MHRQGGGCTEKNVDLLYFVIVVGNTSKRQPEHGDQILSMFCCGCIRAPKGWERGTDRLRSFCCRGYGRGGGCTKKEFDWFLVVIVLRIQARRRREQKGRIRLNVCCDCNKHLGEKDEGHIHKLPLISCCD